MFSSKTASKIRAAGRAVAANGGGGRAQTAQTAPNPTPNASSQGVGEGKKGHGVKREGQGRGVSDAYSRPMSDRTAGLADPTNAAPLYTPPARAPLDLPTVSLFFLISFK
jgi:hypothetical protein